MNNLPYSMREVAHLYSAQNRDDPEIQVFTRWDGMSIPAGTRIKVIVVLEHIPDPEITLDLVMDVSVEA